MAFWHPCHTLACWALGAHFGWGQQQMPHSFRPNHPQVPKSHWAGMPTAQRRQKITKMPVGTKNSQPQGPSGKELLPHQTTAKTSQEHLWACPSKVLAARANAASQGACLVGATWTCAFFWGWAAFHGNFLLWAASMPPCQCACPQSWVRPKLCSLG